MVSASGSKPFLCQLSVRGEVKEDAVHHHGQSEDNGRAWILFLGPDEIWCCTSTWVDTCARMVGMVVQESISAGSLEVGMDEVGMDEVGKAHGTSVGTLLEVDGRAPCTDGDADVDADADAGGETSFLGLKESEIETDNFLITVSPIGSTFSCADYPPVTKDSS